MLPSLLLIFLAWYLCPAFAFTPVNEIAALHALYNATIGEEWDYNGVIKGHWNFSLPYNETNPCNEVWYGLTCTKIQARCDTELCSILEINLASTNLRGTLPDALTLLTALGRFSMSVNRISGSLPDWLVLLPNIYYIGLWDNYFTGSIPISWTAIPALNYLDVIDNFITGTIPLGLGNLVNFATLRASANLLSGPLPSSIVGTTRFNNIEVESNWLTGSLPELGVSIRTAVMSNNFFSGSLSSAYLGYASLNDVYLLGNYLTSSLPEVLDVNTRMQFLHLGNNFFTGSMPISLTKLKSVLFLHVGNNILTGSFDRNDVTFMWKGVSYLDVSYNHMRGSLPEDLFTITNMQYLFLHGNAFSGSLPNNIVYNSKIQQLSLFDNELTGTLPIALGAIPQLQALLVQNNMFFGRISELFQRDDLSIIDPFPSLQVIDLSSNRFSGTVPSSLFSLSNIQHVAIVQNCLEGTLPAEICDASSLETLLLEGLRSGKFCRNELWDPARLINIYLTDGVEGSIPECIFEMTNLRTLHITGNHLGGTIPSTFNMSQLLDLKLSDNRLSGRIPQFLQQRIVNSIDLSRNRLKGNFDLAPRTSESSSLTLSVNRLSGHIAKHFKTIDKLDVLVGNLFYCDSRNDVPSHDPDSSAYVCGSDAYDLPLLTWLLFFSVLFSIFAVLLALYHRSISKLPATHEGNWFMSAIIPLHCKCLTWRNALSEANFFKYSQVAYFISTLRHVRVIACALAAFIILWYGVLYYAAKKWGGYGTHVYQYRWMFTAAYLSGILPAALMLITLLCISSLLLRQVYTEYNRLTLQLLDPTTNMQRAPAQEFESVNTDPWLIWKSYGYITAATLANVAIVLLVKGVYVYLLIWRDISASSQVALNISLSLFDVMWNAVVVTKAVSLFPPLVRSKIRIRWHLLLLLFNSIVAPMIAAACTDRNCFVEVFVGRDEVTSSSSYDLCSDVDPITCKAYDTLYVTTRFTPPFVYSYQCMSAILANFIPVFIFSHIILGFIMPLLLLGIMKWLSSSMKAYNVMRRLIPFPGVLFPSLEDGVCNNNAVSVVMRPGIILSNLLNHLTVMLTFGIAAPPLAICIAWTISVMTWLWCIVVGRYVHYHRKLSGDVEHNHVAPLVRLNDACKDIWQGPMKAVWVTVDCSCLFFMFMGVDMVGDDYGLWRVAYCVVLPSIAALLLLRLVCKVNPGQVLILLAEKNSEVCLTEVAMSPLAPIADNASNHDCPTSDLE